MTRQIPNTCLSVFYSELMNGTQQNSLRLTDRPACKLICCLKFKDVIVVVLPASKIICLQADFRALINSLKFVVPKGSADFKVVVSPKVNNLRNQPHICYSVSEQHPPPHLTCTR